MAKQCMSVARKGGVNLFDNAEVYVSLFVLFLCFCSGLLLYLYMLPFASSNPLVFTASTVLSDMGPPGARPNVLWARYG
jgi:hypothetical protein